jgi:hypothetical protein
MGVFTQGILADRWLLGALLRPAQRLLGQPRPARVRRTVPTLPGRNANRRMRTRKSGGVEGAGVSPAPTQFMRGGGQQRTSYRNRVMWIEV